MHGNKNQDNCDFHEMVLLVGSVQLEDQLDGRLSTGDVRTVPLCKVL